MGGWGQLGVVSVGSGEVLGLQGRRGLCPGPSVVVGARPGLGWSRPTGTGVASPPARAHVFTGSVLRGAGGLFGWCGGRRESGSAGPGRGH